MILPQHVHQILVYALGQENGHTRPNAHDLYMRNLPQPGQNPFEDRLWQNEWIAPREQHIAYLRRAGNVRQLPLIVGGCELYLGIFHHSATSAMPTATGALRIHQHKHPVGVAMNQSVNRGVLLFGKRVFQLPVEANQLLGCGHNLPTDRAVRIIAVHEAGEIGRHANAEVPVS